MKPLYLGPFKKCNLILFRCGLQDGAPKIAFSCLISGETTMVYGRYTVSIVDGGYNGL